MFDLPEWIGISQKGGSPNFYFHRLWIHTFWHGQANILIRRIMARHKFGCLSTQINVLALRFDIYIDDKQSKSRICIPGKHFTFWYLSLIWLGINRPNRRVMLSGYNHDYFSDKIGYFSALQIESEANDLTCRDKMIHIRENVYKRCKSWLLLSLSFITNLFGNTCQCPKDFKQHCW